MGCRSNPQIKRKGVCATIIAVLSYAFRLRGALLLLLWCIGKCDANVVRLLSQSSGSAVARWTKEGAYTTSLKEDLQESAKNVYLNIASFADLAIGYTGDFVTDLTIPHWLV